MRGTILQTNISPGGVPKRSILRAEVTPLGILGDAVNHPRFHGGPRKAILLLAQEVVDALREEGYPVFAGALGENLTTTGLDPAQMRTGQRYRVGTCVLELTTLRVPCATLDVYGQGIQKRLYDRAAKAGDTSSPVWARGGFYAAVVQSGEIQAGDTIELLDQVV